MKTTGVVAFLLAASASLISALPAPIQSPPPQVSGFMPPSFNNTRPWNPDRGARVQGQEPPFPTASGSVQEASFPTAPAVVPTPTPLPGNGTTF
ncbi:hypothetical protein CDV31_013816 [Fusarium ambrosium]|uniref:Uncharacterized protein n=1 Tax=Fusarium ambrosium TaxID=131363 RepID=A0A428T0N7_9HYPO|nr:hypothetical protein CDV31_013816 [Fusarium ambrosium]